MFSSFNFFVFVGFVKLSGFTVNHKVQEFSGNLSGLAGHLPEDDVVLTLENFYPPYSGRSGKKADVHRFGIVMLSLKMGRIFNATYPTFPKDLNPDFKNFIEKFVICFTQLIIVSITKY